jgi:plasmid stability protein
MATLTIRRLPETVVARIKDLAARRGHSMEEEVRALLEQRYAQRATVLTRIQRRWADLPPVTGEQLDDWIEEGR